MARSTGAPESSCRGHRLRTSTTPSAALVRSSSSKSRARRGSMRQVPDPSTNGTPRSPGAARTSVSAVEGHRCLMARRSSSSPRTSNRRGGVTNDGARASIQAGVATLNSPGAEAAATEFGAHLRSG